MSSVSDPSLDVLLHSVSSQTSIGPAHIEDKHSRPQLLKDLRKLISALETPEYHVQRVVFFPSTYACARIAIDLKLFNIIADASGGISSSELATKTGAEEQLIVRVLRGLTYAGLVTEAGDRVYAANAITQHLKTPSVQAGMIHFYDAGLRSLSTMPEYFRKNGFKLPSDSVSGPLQYAFHTPLESYAYWNTMPEFADNFNTFMAGKLGATKTGQSWEKMYPVKSNIIDAFDQKIGDTMFVDIAGGRGHEVAQLKIDYPNAPGRFILQDLPAVIDDVKDLHSGIERMKFNFFDPQPIRGSRAYFMANIMHNWTDADCRKILLNTAKVMVKGYSKLLLSDHILPSTGCGLESLGRDIGMLSLHGGVERSESQWTALLESAGLKVVKFWYMDKGEGLVEAELQD
ncbi:S-adenosyl-L-methionine-dependent methyltransferase [Mollisia scopiformis]|uniref:S-adenosyl-L-methionine-dependent methyltransferase n=1 Tax=Mollisia scopiformis TaxID=149040 RepID=A0A132BCP0_MOLSC|nr:S-adenosyl-L-methionine-dependent methyltransferase [Mollisia scopiformis]KUJ10141.1 S-adenosyl-L-methionine-dependent methyltransferase [Mollisia scopiformis]